MRASQSSLAGRAVVAVLLTIGFDGLALAVALAGQGWTCDTSPGAQVSLQKDENRIEPFVTVAKLASGELPADAWQALCDQVGIAGLPLAAAG